MNFFIAFINREKFMKAFPREFQTGSPTNLTRRYLACEKQDENCSPKKNLRKERKKREARPKKLVAEPNESAAELLYARRAKMFSRNKEVSYRLLKCQNFKCCFDVEGNKSGRPGLAVCL